MEEVKDNQEKKDQKKTKNSEINKLKAKIEKLELKIDKANKSSRKTRQLIDAYMNRKFAEIRVLPEGHNPKLQGGNNNKKWENGWEDYSGNFYVDNEELEEIIIDKARKHFKSYFEDNVYHRNKKLGLFLSGGGTSGKKLIEEYKTDN